MRIHDSRRALAALMLVALCACGQDLTSPRTSDAPAEVRPSAARRAPATDTNTTTFVYTPRTGGTYTIARVHYIVLPAYSICDPRQSTYGPTQWDAPCIPVRHRMPIVAKSWMDPSGHPRVQFGPELRFVPTTRPERYVRLFLRDPDATDPVLSGLLTILSCNDLGACVDEAKLDPTLRTWVSPATGMLWCRIMHFSGYNVAAGRGDATAY